MNVAAGPAIHPPLLRTWRRIPRAFRRPKIIVGAGVVLTLFLIGLVGPLLTDVDPNKQALRETLIAPQGWGAKYVLGTDVLGRDVFTRIVYGARISLIIAGSVVLISGVVGVLLGAISGYVGGRLDFAIQKVVEIVWAFPSLLLAIVIIAFLGGSLLNLIIALVAQRWIAYCRVIRGDVMVLREREFMIAAKVIGASTPRIMFRHLLPNVLGSAMVIATFSMAGAIISEASLSFLGLGVPSSIPTWGAMLADGRTYVTTAPWLTVFPGIAIFVTILGINLLGDGLRDALDPRLRHVGS